MTELNNLKNFKNTVIVFLSIIGICSILGLVGFIKSFNSKNNFEAQSTSYCLPCVDSSGNSYTNAQGDTIACRTIENWLKSPNGGGKMGISFVDDGNGKEIMTVTQSQKLLNYNGNKAETNSYVNVDNLLSNSVYYDMVNLFNMSFANVKNFENPLPMITNETKNFGNSTNVTEATSASKLYLINYPKSITSPHVIAGDNTSDYLYTSTFMELVNNFFSNKPPTIQIYIGCRINQYGYYDTSPQNTEFAFTTYTVMCTSDSYSSSDSKIKPLNPTGIKTNPNQEFYTPNGYAPKYDGYEIIIPTYGTVPEFIQYQNRGNKNVTLTDSPRISRTLYMFAVYDNYRFTTESYRNLSSSYYVINNAPYIYNPGTFISTEMMEYSGGPTGDVGALPPGRSPEPTGYNNSWLGLDN